jgi:hypothetical protein
MIDDNRISTGPILEPPRRQSLPSSFQQLRVHTDWRTSWTHIVAGKFSDAHDDGVLFHEGSTGFAEIYDTDGHGNLSLLRQHQDLGRIGSRSHRWTQIIAGRFSSSQNSSLLLVDAHSRFAAIFNVDATGNLMQFAGGSIGSALLWKINGLGPQRMRSNNDAACHLLVKIEKRHVAFEARPLKV